MLKVSDIMTRDVFTLTADTSAEEAAWGLTARCIGGAPVRERGRLVGVISKSDLTDPGRVDWGGGEKTVRDLMTRRVLAIASDEPAIEAVHEMVRAGIHRLLVLDQRHRVVGIVTAMDVLKALDHGATIARIARVEHPHMFANPPREVSP